MEWVLNPVTDVFIRGLMHKDTYTQGIRLYEEGEIGVPTSQGTPRIAWNHEKLEEAKKDSSLEPSQGEWSYRYFDFVLFTSGTVRK